MVYNKNFYQYFIQFIDDVSDVLRPLQDKIEDLESEMRKKGILILFKI